MEIAEDRAGGRLVLAPRGRLDAHTAPEFGATVSGRIDSGETRVLIDLGEIEYISSDGLRALLVAGKKAQGLGGDVALCTLRAQVREVLEVAGFLALFPIHDNRAAAVGG